jgi:SAM-dependent methyltransferase
MRQCRFCKTPLSHLVVSLGNAPLSNAYLTAEQLRRMEPFYPLEVFVCADCFLVQLDEFEPPEHIFSDYAYFSSYSRSWLEHCRRYCEEVVRRFGLGGGSRVVEIGSNDGSFLRCFIQRGISALGVDPAANVAAVAEENGIPTRVAFFGSDFAHTLASEGLEADLILGNNVLAHVPDLNGFVQGMKILLKPQGIISMEFPHLLKLMQENQFDTIYHEHFSYFSFLTVSRVFAAHGLTIFDVEEVPTHGGSLRIFARHAGAADAALTPRAAELLEREAAGGVTSLDHYAAFGERVKEVKRNLLDFLIQAKRKGKRVVGYGAPAKGNTLLNYCGIRTDFLDFTVDLNPHKQGRFLPGSHIPIREPERIMQARPDYVLILPWNIKQEIMDQLTGIRAWGGQFVVPIPEVQVL